VHDAVDALSEAAELFEDLRAGLAMTAQSSTRLADIEERLARAADSLQQQS
jgi:hypothetical protein